MSRQTIERGSREGEALNRLFRLLLIEPREARAVAAMALYFFLAMGAATVVKTLQFTFFLRNIGFDWRLPFLYVVSAALAVPVVLLYRRLARESSHLTLAAGTLLLFAAGLLVVSVLLEGGVSWSNFAFFLLGGLFTLLAPTLGWIISYDLFTTREGKRVFGLLGMGGILGGAAGGYGVLVSVGRFGTRGLIVQVLAVIVLLLGVLLVIRVWVPLRRRDFRGAGDPASAPGLPKSDRQAGKARHSPYLRSIARMVFLSGVVTTVVDLNYINFLGRRYPGSEYELTEFISALLGSMFLVSGFLQLFGTGRLLRRFGIPVALLVLPVGLAVGGLIAAAAAGFWSAVFLKVIDGALRTSLYRTSVEVLYIPAAPREAVTFKSFVDLVVFRTGDASGALVFLLTGMVLDSARLVPVLVALTALLWIYLGRQTAVAYMENLRESVRKAALRRRRLRLDELLTPDLVEAYLGNAEGWRVRKALEDLAVSSETADRVGEAVGAVGEESLESHISLLYDRRPGWFRTVTEIVNGPDPETGAAAFRLLVRHDPATHLQQLKEALRRESPPETVYLFYLAAYVDHPAPFLDSTLVLKWCGQESGERGAALARIMGKTGSPDYLPVLARWLFSSDLLVQRGAIEAIGRYAAPEFWDPLVSFLSTPSRRDAACRGLSHYGEQAVERLMSLLSDPTTAIAVKRQIPLILGRISSSNARARLMVALFWPDPVVSFRALKTLNKTRAYHELSYAEESFLPVLMQWARQYYELLALRAVVPAVRSRAWKLLDKVAGERQLWTIEKIFRTLDLFLPKGEAYLSYLAFQDRTFVRDNAIELIEFRLKGQIRQVVLPIFTVKDQKELLKIGRRFFGLPDGAEAVLAKGLDQEDPVARAAVLAVIGEERIVGLVQEVRRSLPDRTRLVSQTAAWALERMES